MMWIIRYLFPNEPECQSCNHKSFCDEGIPNCATHSPMRKAKPSMPVMSFGPRMKRYSRPVFDETGRHPRPWEYALAFALFVFLVSFTGAML